VLGALRRLIDEVGKNTAPTMGAIARLGENSTRMRFRDQRGPDGQPWKPSLRAQLVGGRTLTKDGHLSGSISSGYGKDFAEWGFNRVYAAIHHFGGVIKAKSGGALKFPLPNGGFAVVKQVRIPARPALGINDDDRDDILDILERRIVGSSGGAAHAG
jgi:phage virion morphogenesis protein